MKKYLVVLAVLLMGSSASSQSYPITPRLDSLRATILLQLRATATGTRFLTDPVVNTAINRAIYATCTKFPALEKFDTVTIANSVEGGTLPTDFVRILNVWRIDSVWRLPLQYMSPDSFRVKMKSKDLYQQNKNDPLSPEYYYTYGRKLMQLPKWTKAESDSLLIQYLAVDTKLSSDSDTTIILPEYLENVINYACGILAASRNNLDDANFFLQMFQYGQPVSREEEMKK